MHTKPSFRSNELPSVNASDSSPILVLCSSTMSICNNSSNFGLSYSSESYATDIWSLISRLLSLVPWMIGRLASFALIFVPSAVITVIGGLFGRTVNITLRLSSLLIICLLLIAIVWAVIRYKYLTIYSRLLPEQERQEPKMDIFPDSQREEKRKAGLSNYLDDFLSAIKVFGYLDEKVFHELTKQLRTVRLREGEIVYLSDIKGFSMVVEGVVDVYVKSTATRDATISNFHAARLKQFGDSEYQLLNTVQRGAPLSSLFSIVSLFTEDVELSDFHNRNGMSPFSDTNSETRLSERLPSESDLPNLSLNEQAPDDGQLSPSASPPQHAHSHSSNIRRHQYDASFGSSESLFNGRRRGSFHLHMNNGTRRRSNQRSSHHRDHLATDFDILAEDIVCRASQNSTIAILPAEAFRTLTKKYPSAASHIVQVILTRCQRVTFETCHNYLGLTPAIFEAEATLNSRAKYELPVYIHDGAIRKLKELAAERKSKMVYLRQPPKMKRTPGNRAAKDIVLGKSRHVVLEPDETHPGDLLSTVPLSRIEPSKKIESPAQFSKTNRSSRTSLRFTGDDETEDSILRTALMECIFKLLGFDGCLVQKKIDTMDIGPSTEASPMFMPVESKADDRIRTGLIGRSTSILGSLGRLESEHTVSDGDASSIENFDDSQKRHSRSQPNYENAQQEAADLLDVMYCEAGSVLCYQGDRSPGLYFVIDGVLEVGYTDKDGQYQFLYDINPGGIAGFIGSIIGSRSFVQIRAKTAVYVGMLSRQALEKITEKYPLMFIAFAKTLNSALSRFIVDLDFGLEWVQMDAGQALYQQGDKADATYFVLSGRLRGITENTKGDTTHVEEFGNGDTIGELEALTNSTYDSTFRAIRDSELARLPSKLYEGLIVRYPSLTFNISGMVATRVSKFLNRNPTLPVSCVDTLDNGTVYRTVAVVPITSGIPVNEFSEKLTLAFHDTNRSCALVNNASMLTFMGRHAFNKLGNLKLTGYLRDLEDKYQMIVYVADSGVKSPWSQKCITQADCVLLLADANGNPDISEYEHLLLKTKTTARTDLVLLHPEKNVVSGSTREWLKNRFWVYSHHHVQFNLSINQVPDSPSILSVHSRLQRIRSRVMNLQSDLFTRYRSRETHYYSANAVYKNDFNRLARILSGQAVGLVLGGGGARGISQIGVIQALEENGIPIDYVGGTSIGAFVGALYAREYDTVSIYGRAKKFAQRIGSLWRMALDITYPTTAYTTGHEFNRGIWKALRDSRIEDFWLRYYTNTTNITHSRREIHSSGYSWRYVRASMSLAGLLPPITDKGSMLLDGGYVDNLTVSQMQSWGAKYIFAVDVGSVDDTTPMQYGDTLSGLWAVFNRWNFFSKHPNVPSMTEIQQRLAYVSSVGELERAKNAEGVIYMRPPIDGFATLDFGKFEDILLTGSRYGHDFLARLKEEGKLPLIPGAADKQKGSTKRSLNRRYSI